MVYGLWFMVYGLWFMVYGLWFMVYGLWFLVRGYRGQGVGLFGSRLSPITAHTARYVFCTC